MGGHMSVEYTRALGQMGQESVKRNTQALHVAAAVGTTAWTSRRQSENLRRRHITVDARGGEKESLLELSVQPSVQPSVRPAGERPRTLPDTPRADISPVYDAGTF